MAEFKSTYSEMETEKGDVHMNDGIGVGAGAGFLGGAILGGLGGYALAANHGDNWRNGAFPYPMAVQPAAINGGCYSIADVSNLVATKDAQYAQLNATQESRFDVLSTVVDKTNLINQGICNLGYENAKLNGQNQLAISEASAKADLCCCKTQGMIGQIVPEIKNFYLTDQVNQLRNQATQQQIACGFNTVNNELGVIGCGVKSILEKLYTPTTTTTTATP